MLTIKKLPGFTLIELLISIALSAIIFLALMSVFIANINHYQKSINTTRLNQQLEGALQIIVNDIRRAGYSSTANNDLTLDQNTNPFQAAATDISVNAGNNCILFSYDHANNGILPAISSAADDDRYGYQLRNGAIQARPPGATFACGAANWENVTDPNIVNITALTFTLNSSNVTTGPATRGLTMRSVDISVTGQLVNNAAVTRTLTQHVRLRND